MGVLRLVPGAPAGRCEAALRASRRWLVAGPGAGAGRPGRGHRPDRQGRDPDHGPRGHGGGDPGLVLVRSRCARGGCCARRPLSGRSAPPSARPALLVSTSASSRAAPAAADYLELTKPRITLMVVLTALVGFVMGSPAGRSAFPAWPRRSLGHRPGGRRGQRAEHGPGAPHRRASCCARATGRCPPAACAPRKPWPAASRLTVAGLGLLRLAQGPLAAAGRLRDLGQLPVPLHAAQDADVALDARGRIPGRPAPGDRLGRRARRSWSRARSSCSRSCSCGRSRTSSPSPGSTARTTRAAGSPCCPVLDPGGRGHGPAGGGQQPRPAAGEPDPRGGRHGRTGVPRGGDRPGRGLHRRRGLGRGGRSLPAARALFLASVVYLPALCGLLLANRL